MGSCFARNLGGNLFKDVADARNESSDHRILSTEHTEDTDFLSTEGTEDTDFFGELLRKKSWRKSLIKIWPVARNHYGSTEHTEDTDFFG